MRLGLTFDYDRDARWITIDETCTGMYGDTCYVLSGLYDEDSASKLRDVLRGMCDEADVGVTSPAYAPEMKRTVIKVPSSSNIDIDFSGGYA